MEEIVETKYNGTYPIKLPKQRAEALALNGEAGWEKARIDAMHDTIKKGDTVMYVGSEQGDIPALCALWGADVVLIEASNLMWGNVKTIFEANNIKPVEIFKGFAGNSTNVRLNRNVRKSEYDKIEASWQKDPGFYELHTARNVATAKIDDLVADGMPVPDIIAMDIEGSEGEAIMGAEQTILKHKPVIFLSLHPEFLYDYWNMYSRELRNFILDRGYQETFLDYQHEVHFKYEPNKD